MSALEGERVVHAACGKWYTAAITGVRQKFEDCMIRFFLGGRRAALSPRSVLVVASCFPGGGVIACLCRSAAIHHYAQPVGLDSRLWSRRQKVVVGFEGKAPF